MKKPLWLNQKWEISSLRNSVCCSIWMLYVTESTFSIIMLKDFLQCSSVVTLMHRWSPFDWIIKSSSTETWSSTHHVHANQQVPSNWSVADCAWVIPMFIQVLLKCCECVCFEHFLRQFSKLTTFSTWNRTTVPLNSYPLAFHQWIASLGLLVALSSPSQLIVQAPEHEYINQVYSSVHNRTKGTAALWDLISQDSTLIQQFQIACQPISLKWTG